MTMHSGQICTTSTIHSHPTLTRYHKFVTELTEALTPYWTTILAAVHVFHCSLWIYHNIHSSINRIFSKYFSSCMQWWSMQSMHLMSGHIYTPCPPPKKKKRRHQTHGHNSCQTSTNFLNSFTGRFLNKFAVCTFRMLLHYLVKSLVP